MSMPEVRVPEVFVERMRARFDGEDELIWLTCWDLADGWEEMGDVLAEEKAREMGWSDAEKRGKTHKWFIESLCGELNMSPSLMYDRKRVGVNILKRNLKQENMNFSVCAELLRNCTSTDDQIIPEEEVKERIAWFNDMTDQYGGKPPSIREIKKHFRRNREKEGWRILLESAIRNLKEIEETDAPRMLKSTVRYVLKGIAVGQEQNWYTAGADSTGGERST